MGDTTNELRDRAGIPADARTITLLELGHDAADAWDEAYGPATEVEWGLVVDAYVTAVETAALLVYGLAVDWQAVDGWAQAHHDFAVWEIVCEDTYLAPIGWDAARKRLGVDA